MNPTILGILIVFLIFLLFLIGVHILVVHMPKIAEQLPLGVKLIHYYGAKCIPQTSKNTPWCCKIRVKTASGSLTMNYFMFKTLLDNIQKTIVEIKSVSKIHPEINDNIAIKTDLYTTNMKLNDYIEEINLKDVIPDEIAKTRDSKITRDHIETDPEIEKMKFDNQIDELESKVQLISKGPYLQYYDFAWLDKILNVISHELLFQQILINNEISHEPIKHFIPIPEIENPDGWMGRIYPGKSTKEYSITSIEGLTNLKCPKAAYYEAFMGEKRVSTPPQDPYFNLKGAQQYFDRY